MGITVCCGALLKCSFGLAPGSLYVLPINRVKTLMPIVVGIKNNGEIAIRLLLVLIILNLMQTAQAGDWPMFMHDAAHTGATNEIIEPPLEILWKYKTAGTWYSPAISGGIVYVGSDYLYAIDASTGILKWKYQTGKIVTSSPAVSKELVYFISNDYLYALDKERGTSKWTFTRSLRLSPPIFSGGVVYISAARGGHLVSCWFILLF